MSSATSPAPSPFTRLIAPFEHWYLAFPKSVAPLMTFCVEGFGNIDADRLRAAVASASQACPGARLRRSATKWVDSGQTPPVRVVHGRTFDPAVPREVPELRTVLPDASGANCDVVLFDGPRPTIVFRASHIVMDARGLLIWITDIFQALRGEVPSGATSTLTMLDLDDAFYKQADATKQEFVIPSLLGMPKRANGCLWRRRTIDGTFPALAAKIATHIAANSGLPSAKISFPVDLRPFHEEVQTERSTSNLSLTVELDIPAEQSWENTYAQMLAMLAERKGEVHAPGPEVLRAPLWVLNQIIKGINRRTKRRDRFAQVIGVNGLGRLDAAAFSTEEFDAFGMYLLESQEPGSPQGVVLAETEGRTELTLTWWDGEEQGKRADALLDDLCEMLSPAANRRYSEMLSAAPTRKGELSADTGVVDQFRAQVKANPEAIAISGPEGDVSYAELEHKARVVAGALRERGIGRDTVVGLLADRTVNAVAGAWGVLLAGAAYLPMDTKHPDGRIRTLLDSARSPVCLVQKPHDSRDFLPEGCAPLVIDELPFSAEAPEITGSPAPDDLAYVVYTSGSTGAPKGVEIEHGSLSNYASWAVRDHGITSSTRLPLLVSLSFDVAEISLILPFLVGGTLLLMGDELTHVAVQEVLDNGATMLSLTPSHLDLITRLDLEPRNVRTLVVIGEQFTRSVAVRAQELFGQDCRIINHYGPAEATIGVSQHFFDADRDTGAAVPIGEPLDGVTFYLLTPDRQFVAPGESGELYIGGNQLARGYRGRPDLTRQRFVRMADGSRVYRTGDIARRLESGAVEFCGRIDDQLKILGHRIEPAEISQTLETHPTVDSAVVVPRSRPGGKDKTLVGYVVGAAEMDIAALTSYLEERLPHYMVPAVLVEVDEIPRSVNGKVSVKTLPDPFATKETVVVDSGSMNDVEDAVARIWSKVLDVQTDSIESASDFHRMGGDSVSLIAMVAMVARQVVGQAGERGFTSRMQDIIGNATVSNIAELAQLAKIS